MIKVFRDATVVANAVTAASAAAPESVTGADAETATWPAAGSEVPPVALALIVAPAAGMYTVYSLCGSVEVPIAPAAGDEVVTEIAVSVSEPFPAADESEIQPAANKLANTPAGTNLPVESRTCTASVAFSPGA